MCVVVLAVVTTFHICDAERGQAADVRTVSVTAPGAGDGGASPLKAVEKCPTCALVLMPAVSVAEQTVDVVRAIPAGTTASGTPFSQPAIGPPPRA
ncbi:MAG: hypothetical protein JSR24_13680 [Proteobacteria bacterium]|nr:hypothetical protein [Pseudomonadota bacterium]